MRTWVALVAAPTLALGLFVSSSPADVPGLAPPPPAVVHDQAGHLLDESAYPGVVPEFRERYVSDRPSAEPWLAFTASGRVMTNSIFTPSVTGVVAAQSPTMASDDNGKTWKDVSPSIAGMPALLDGSNDTLITTDPWSGRIYKTAYSAGCLQFFISDDQGESWIPRPEVCDQSGIISDHPSVFVGKAFATLPNQQAPVYACTDTLGSLGPQNRIYGYNLTTACMRSDDGALTWFEVGQPFPHPPTCAQFTGVAGFGIGSRIDDDVYMPAGKCGVPWLAISHDYGLHWDDVAMDTELGMSPDVIDSLTTQVAEDRAGNLYYAWIARDGLPRVAMSTTRGRTWSTPVKVAAPGLTVAKFATITAGSRGRIAVGYVGSTVPGGYDATKEDMAVAEWHPYVTMTLDALAPDPVFASGQTDPAGDPVRRGPCFSRCYMPDGITGMYDYIRADTNPITGAVVASLVDLCVDGCPDPASSAGRAAVSVQVGGTGLFGSLVDDAFSADATGPTISIADPSPPVAAAGATLDVSGLASDDQTVARVSVTVESQIIGGGTTEAVCSGCGTPSASWSVTVLIPPGPSTMYATAYDAAGNRTDTTRMVVVGA